MIIKFAKLDYTGTIPTKAHDDDLGWDIYASETITIPAHSNALIPTSIACQFPSNVGGILKDRSSVSSKQRIYVKAGVIDPSYRGEIKVLMENPNDEDVIIKDMQKIAQMILVESIQATSIEVNRDELNETVRADKGFGSSGQ